MAPLDVKPVLLPAQIVGVVALAVTTGKGLTVTVTGTGKELHAPVVPITEYVIVLAGFAVGFETVVELRFVAGLQT